MSELMNTHGERSDFRWQLLATVSALALIATVYEADVAIASQDDRPMVWIELGGQLERVDSGQETFAPPFILNSPRPPAETISPLSVTHDPRFSKGAEAFISISPRDTDWVFSASVRYGRSNGEKHLHQQSYPKPIFKYYPSGYHTAPAYPLAAKFSDAQVKKSQQHFVMDFKVGKDVGLGMFGGRQGTSVVDLGVRFAQFSSRSNIAFKSNPDWRFSYKYLSFPSAPITNVKIVRSQPYHSNIAHFSTSRSFHGIGPSLSWKASAPVAGSAETSEISFDWGVNAAVLFGRQKARTHHQTTSEYHHLLPGQFRTVPASRVTLYQNPATPDHTRSRSLVVPNIGGFAGVSFKYVNAKISLGYRADFFFGAMDGGIDTRKTYDRNFHGPFATVSIGLGG
jgi:hypothetical protein